MSGITPGVSGRAGDSVTFFASDRATDVSVTVLRAPRHARLVVNTGEAGRVITLRPDDDARGQLPPVVADVRRATVEFDSDGDCEVVVAARRAAEGPATRPRDEGPAK